MWQSVIGILPRGNTLSEADWQRRHRLLQWVLLAHVPVLAAIGLWLGNPLVPLAIALAIPVVCVALGRLLRDGDVMTGTVGPLGTQRTRVVAP